MDLNMIVITFSNNYPSQGRPADTYLLEIWSIVMSLTVY